MQFALFYAYDKTHQRKARDRYCFAFAYTAAGCATTGVPWSLPELLLTRSLRFCAVRLMLRMAPRYIQLMIDEVPPLLIRGSG